MKLPPLNALRAFEAAARHDGFIAAAEELHVTRGAISRHVKLLEAHLGVPLFRRNTSGVTLTEAGQRLLPVLTESFTRIAAETARLASDATDLRLICPPTTSIRWLLPRLDLFRQRHPEIRVRLTTDFYSYAGFDSLEYDLGFSVEHWPNRAGNIRQVVLLPVWMTPACAPALAERLARPEDLRHHLLLHETASHRDWRDWLAHFPVEGLDAESGHDFPNLDMATRAAVMGTGIVMADRVLCQDELTSGALVMPFPELTCGSPLGDISLLGSADVWDSPKVRAFRDWAEETAAGDLARLDLP